MTILRAPKYAPKYAYLAYLAIKKDLSGLGAVLVSRNSRKSWRAFKIFFAFFHYRVVGPCLRHPSTRNNCESSRIGKLNLLCLPSRRVAHHIFPIFRELESQLKIHLSRFEVRNQVKVRMGEVQQVKNENGI